MEIIGLAHKITSVKETARDRPAFLLRLPICGEMVRRLAEAVDYLSPSLCGLISKADY
jgi:hypothetical protein